MSFHRRFTSLARQLLSLADAGKKLDIGETHLNIRNNTLFSWLEEKFPGRVDLSFHDRADLEYMEREFSKWSQVVDERRKMEIEKNGLCLLIAYCLEAVEGDPETIQDKTEA